MDDDADVMLESVRVVREADGNLVCVIEGLMRFIPTEHVRSRTPGAPGNVETLVIPGWLGASLGLP